MIRSTDGKPDQPRSDEIHGSRWRDVIDGAEDVAKTVARHALNPVASSGSRVVLASPAGSRTAPAKFLREIKPGEKIDDLINEGKGLSWSDEIESAIVTLEKSETENAKRIVVTGGRDGIEFMERDGKVFMEIEGRQVQVKRVIGHTHPVATGPSQGDVDALRKLGQKRSYIVELGGAKPDAQIFRPK